jgi:transcription initiation protein SPT3
VRYIEDSIKSEMAALVVAARNLAAFHGSPVITAENLLFLLRKQPAQVQRLKAYLAWREVRRKAFKGEADADGETLIIDELDEESGPPAVVNERLRSSKRIRIETPWDLVSSLVYESEMQTCSSACFPSEKADQRSSS